MEERAGMYAIIEDGGRQYRVTQGDQILIDLRDAPEQPGRGEVIRFDRVLFVGQGAQARIGTPYLSDATVSASVVEALKMPKVVGIKFNRRKGYRKKWGHRQRMLRVQIREIQA